MKAEYKEGPEARENFEHLAKALFQMSDSASRRCASVSLMLTRFAVNDLLSSR